MNNFHFKPRYKTRQIRRLFDKISGSYDRNNIIISLGQTTIWRKRALSLAEFKGRVLDLGCGTGKAVEILKNKQNDLDITGLDISSRMLRKDISHLSVSLLLGDAGSLPFSDGSFDCLISFYTLRNLKNIENTLDELLRCLKKGGQLLFLDAFPAGRGFIGSIHSLWLGKFVPLLPGIFTCRGAYKYLADSIARHTDKESFAILLESKGMKRIAVENYTFGFATAFLYRKT